LLIKLFRSISDQKLNIAKRLRTLNLGRKRSTLKWRAEKQFAMAWIALSKKRGHNKLRKCSH